MLPILPGLCWNGKSNPKKKDEQSRKLKGRKGRGDLSMERESGVWHKICLLYNNRQSYDILEVIQGSQEANSWLYFFKMP